jgi:hypothetical protein
MSIPRIRSIDTIQVTSVAPTRTAATPTGLARTSVRRPLSAASASAVEDTLTAAADPIGYERS